MNEDTYIQDAYRDWLNCGSQVHRLSSEQFLSMLTTRTRNSVEDAVCWRELPDVLCREPRGLAGQLCAGRNMGPVALREVHNLLVNHGYRPHREHFRGVMV